jgi:hypothetical protein
MGDKDKLVWKDLPLISTLPPNDFRHAKKNIDEIDSLDETISIAKARREKLMDELGAIQRKAKLKGFRFGTLAYAWRVTKGRKTLSPELLLTNGVKAVVIEKSYKVGEPGEKQEFRDLDKPRGKGKGKGEEGNGGREED